MKLVVINNYVVLSITVNWYFFTAGAVYSFEQRTQYLDDVNTDVSKMLKYLGKNDTKCRDFRCVSVEPPVYVYVYQTSELTSNSSVNLLAWDQFAEINHIENYELDHKDILNIDLEPFLWTTPNCRYTVRKTCCYHV